MTVSNLQQTYLLFAIFTGRISLFTTGVSDAEKCQCAKNGGSCLNEDSTLSEKSPISGCNNKWSDCFEPQKCYIEDV